MKHLTEKNITTVVYDEQRRLHRNSVAKILGDTDRNSVLVYKNTNWK